MKNGKSIKRDTSMSPTKGAETSNGSRKRPAENGMADPSAGDVAAAKRGGMGKKKPDDGAGSPDEADAGEAWEREGEKAPASGEEDGRDELGGEDDDQDRDLEEEEEDDDDEEDDDEEDGDRQDDEEDGGDDEDEEGDDQGEPWALASRDNTVASQRQVFPSVVDYGPSWSIARGD